MRILNGFGWFWGLGGAGGGETPFNAKNEEGSADSSKTEGTPQRGVLLGSCFGPQMWQILMVFTRVRRFQALQAIGGDWAPTLVVSDVQRGPKRGVFEGSRGSLLRCLGRFRGFRRFEAFQALGLLPSWFRTCKRGPKGAFSRVPGGPTFGV